MALPDRHLFLSKRLVTDSGVAAGGVLVDEHGIIEQIVTKRQADKIKAESDGKIKVILNLNYFILLVFISHTLVIDLQSIHVKGLVCWRVSWSNLIIGSLGTYDVGRLINIQLKKNVKVNNLLYELHIPTSYTLRFDKGY